MAGSAHALPFKDGSFARVTSFLGIFGSLDIDENALNTSVDEALRVTKRSGELHLGPAYPFAALDSDEQENQRKLIDRLKKNKNLRVSLTLVRVDDFFGRTLGSLIVKKK